MKKDLPNTVEESFRRYAAVHAMSAMLHGEDVFSSPDYLEDVVKAAVRCADMLAEQLRRADAKEAA